MIHLVYVSSATHQMNEEELAYLLEQSRDRNKRHNITGMLLYAGGNFFQVLEGERKDVEVIYDTIVHDERNKDNIVIMNENIDERTFSDWSMGYKHLTKENRASVEGYTEFLDRRMEPDEFTDKLDIVIALLNQFKKGNV